MNKSNGYAQVLHLSTLHGRVEQRSEAYRWYGERVAENLTKQGAKSRGRVSGSAGNWATVVQRLGDG